MEDAQKIVEDLVVKNPKKIKNTMINGLLSAYLNCNKIQEAEELILPMFKSLNLPINSKTYEHFMTHYLKIKKYSKIIHLYKILPQNMLSCTSLNAALTAFYEFKEVEGIC